MNKSTTEKTEWPTIEEQQAYWRTKEADLPLDKVEATTDYIDHQECPNCGRNYDLCQGNCIFDQLPNRGWSEPEWTLRDEVGESYREIP